MADDGVGMSGDVEQGKPSGIDHALAAPLSAVVEVTSGGGGTTASILSANPA